jgi:AAHS family 4-hydroxybenzoate transporter-like MFS transporter
MDTQRAGSLESVIDGSSLGGFQVSILVLCALVAMMDGFDTQLIAFVAPEIVAAWKVPASVFGPVFGVGLLGSLIGALAFGSAGDRFGRKPTLIIAIQIFAVMTLLTPFTTSIHELVIARLLTGIGLGGALPSFIALSSEYAPKRIRTMLVSLMFCGFPAGAVIGGIGSAMLIPTFGWKSVFFAGGIFPLAILPIFLRCVPESARFLATKNRRDQIAKILRSMKCDNLWNGIIETGRVEERAPIRSLFTGERALGTILLWMTLFLSLLLTYFLINWIPIVARQSGLTIGSAVHAVSMLNLGAVVGCVIIGRLADKRGAALMIGISFLLGAAAIAMLGRYGHSSLWLSIIAFFAGAFSIGAQMCTIALCADFYETFLRSTGVGWSIGIGRIGAIVGPVVGGLMLGAGVPVSILFLAVAATSCAAAATVFSMGYFALRSKHQRERSEHGENARTA